MRTLFLYGHFGSRSRKLSLACNIRPVGQAVGTASEKRHTGELRPFRTEEDLSSTIGSAESLSDELPVILNYLPILGRGCALSLWKNTEREVKREEGEGKVRGDILH